MNALPTVLIVPGLRDDMPEHWQTHLFAQLNMAGRPVLCVPPMGRHDLDCASRLDAIDHVVGASTGPLVLVAHSGGCIMTAHWIARLRAQGRQTTLARLHGALLATPPDFERPMPEGYPSQTELNNAAWLPVPRQTLPCRSLVLASRNDPLATFLSVRDLAHDWGSDFHDLGEVGHLNPTSGYGPWPQVIKWIDLLSRD